MAKRNEPAQDVAAQSASVAEVMSVPSPFSRDELHGVNSFDDALRLAQTEYGDVLMAHETELGDGFHVAEEEDKRRLIGVPLIFLSWAFRAGDYSDNYVSIQAVAQGENGAATKWIINDGGTGIAADLRDFTRKTGRTGGLMVRNGLRISEYFIDPENGTPLTKKQYGEYVAAGKKTSKAHTFYLDTSA